MKKILTTFCLILIFFIILFLSENFFQSFTIAGVMPNLFVIFILIIGLSTNFSYGLLFGIFSGLIIDSVYGKAIGITAIMLCIIGYLGAYFDKNFSKENKLTIIVMVAISTIIFESGYYFINSIILNFNVEILYFIKILLIEVFYNIILTIIFYPLIQKSGYAMENVFKKNNIMTRYF